MKTKLLFTLFAISYCMNVNAQTGTPAGDIGDWFIEGISPVQNTISISGLPANTWYVDYYATDPTYTIFYDSLIDFSGGGPWDWTIDMGSLPTDVVVWAYLYDDLGNFIDYTYDYVPAIIPQPTWLTSTYQGSYSNLQVDYGNDVFTLHGTIPIADGNSSVPSSVNGIGGDLLNLNYGQIDFDAEWDMWTGLPTLISPVVYSSYFDALGTTDYVESNCQATNCDIDTNFNLLVNDLQIWQPQGYSVSKGFTNVPLLGIGAGSWFSAGALCVSANLSLQLQPKIKSQVVLDYNSNGDWGFDDGTNSTEVIGKVDATASAVGELKTVCASVWGFGSFGVGTIARGKVVVSGAMGAGYDYSQSQSFYGGDFNIYGEGEVAGIGKKSGTYHPSPWGNSNAYNFKQEDINDEFENFSAKTRSLSNTIPDAWTMGVMSSRDSVLSIAWVDDLNFSQGYKNLLVTNYHALTGLFTDPVTVAYNDSAIEKPSIALLPSHRSIITWSQLNTDGVDTTVSIDDNLKKQNIWFAIHDPISNSIVAREMLTDASGTTPEGEAKIHWGPNNKGIITWQVGDLSNAGSDIYYTVVTENGNTYTFTPPAPISNSVGYNYDIHIAFYGVSSAIAEWIQDPDMDDATINSEVMYSIWDGTNWSAPIARYNTNGLRVKEITLATIGNYGVEAVTYDFTPNTTLINGIFIDWLTGGDPDGAYQQTWVEDTSLYFQLPKAAISQNGIASLSLQIIDVANPDDYGLINLFMKDLNYPTPDWDNVAVSNASYLGDICDANAFVWDASSAFGYINGNPNDVGYFFTQEMDSLGNTHPGTHGQIFGDNDLNLVLRAFQVNSNNGDITITDIDEPNSEPVSAFYKKINSFNNDFELKQNYPNPFSKETIIPFHISTAGNVKFEIYDVVGRLIATFINKDLAAGDYQTEFDSGNLESGIYYYKMIVNNSSATRKMIIAK